MSNFLDEARRVVIEEAQALELLANNLPSTFKSAVNAIYESTGRLIVAGIGKSGHIGRKISSTMASLGQKSFFMHPSEAQHGDLGMIDPSDVLLLISYSGEAVELLPIIDFAKRFGNKIISISKSDDSTLAQNSDIHLCLPNVKEACPLGVAPTVSSTMTLALGDALSVALLSKRGFSREEFKTLHPGGALGKSLCFVFEIMHKGSELPISKSGDSMQQAIVTMTKCGLGCIGITDHQNGLVGIITDGDLRRHMADDLLLKSVNDVMTKTPVSINKNIPASELLFIMETKKITSIFILNQNNEPFGIVHINDLLKLKLA